MIHRTRRPNGIWLCSPFSLFLSISTRILFLPSDHTTELSRGNTGLAERKIDNKALKASELPTAKPLSRQRRGRLPLTEPSAPATSAMTEGWQNNHLNNMAELLPRHWNRAIAPTRVMVGLPLALIAQWWSRPWTCLALNGLQGLVFVVMEC